MSYDDKTVDLVLCTFNSGEDLERFLPTLATAVEPLTVNVIAVDNASRDASADIVEQYGARVIRNQDNLGLTRALNQGAAEGTGEWILIANPDTVLSPGSVARLVETASTDERIGLIGPRIARLDGTPYPTGRRFPGVAVGIVHGLIGSVWKSNPATRAYFGRPVDAVSDVDWISGCCMLFRRTAFETIGGYDERYFMYFEETKIALDMHRGGWRVVLDPAVQIHHREGGSTQHAPIRKVLNHHRSALRFFTDYNRHRPWIALAPLVAAGLALRCVASMARTALAQRHS
ncbi:glycosyltransferase family 2 protein [Nocardia miyunensis]|uniref:glycosyltransferase family 2 protein n=1 Tax=Nocardia miyunensis TaxID=282684 RepID=UPI000829ABB4|nr:glycosyltransferase family 2 protein [Nocardia miyunensis]